MLNAIEFFILVLVIAAAIVAGIITYLLRRVDASAVGTEFYTQSNTPRSGTTAGFSVDNFPSDEIMVPQKGWVINRTTAQIDYLVVPSQAVYLRIAQTGQLLIPTEYLNREYQSTEEFTIDGVRITKRQTPGELALVTWAQDGFDYALYAEGSEMNLIGGVLANFVATTQSTVTE